MEMEILITIGKFAGALVSIFGAFKYLPKGYRWIRSWKLIKRREFERLKTIEAEHHKGEAEKERLRKLDSPIAREIRAQLGIPPELKVETEFSVFDKPKNRPDYKDKEFMYQGFLWLLKEGFWSNCRDLAASAAGDGFLQTAIHGPLCPECKRDLGPLIHEQRNTCACSKRFNVDVPAAHDVKRFGVSVLRRSVYSEAQAAVRRNELHQD